jgi:hypothetical protein
MSPFKAGNNSKIFPENLLEPDIGRRLRSKIFLAVRFGFSHQARKQAGAVA